MNLKLSHDSNGNKILKVSFAMTPTRGERGFCVQTNGNLPETHRRGKADFNRHVAENELNVFVKVYGTNFQKTCLGW